MSLSPVVVDLFSGDEVENWDAVWAAGVRGVILKATEGGNYTDKTYAKRRVAARKAGLLVGAYAFANDTDVETQVDHFLSVAEPDGELLLALDYEPNGTRTMSLAQARRWLELVYEKTGQRPVLYSGNLIKESLTKPDPFFNQHRLWLAQYSMTPRLPVGWTNYWLWQYSGDGTGSAGPHEVDGIATKGIDVNVFGGKDLAAEWAPCDPAWKGAAVAAVQVTTSPAKADIVSASPMQTVATAAKEAYASRSIWAAIVGAASMIWGVLSPGLQAAWDWVTWALDLIPEVKGEVDGVVSPLSEMSKWFGANITNIAMTVSAVCLVIFVWRHLKLRLEAAQTASAQN